MKSFVVELTKPATSAFREAELGVGVQEVRNGRGLLITDVHGGLIQAYNSVHPESAARVGDLIVGANGKQFTSSKELLAEIARAEYVALTLERTVESDTGSIADSGHATAGGARGSSSSPRMLGRRSPKSGARARAGGESLSRKASGGVGDDPPVAPLPGPGGRLRAALWELRRRVVLRWGGVESAAGELCSCGGDIGGSTRVALSAVRAGAEERGFRFDASETCVLFQALGIACSENSTISKEEFLRLDAFESLVAELDEGRLDRLDELMGSLELRRVLLGGMCAPDQLLAQVYLAVMRVSSCEDPDASHSVGVHQDLNEALRKCSAALGLEGDDSRALAETLLSSRGLAVFIEAITSRNAYNESRASAASLLSEALGKLRWRPAEAFLASDLWLPLLRFLDREAEDPPPPPSTAFKRPITSACLDAVMSLLRAARVPAMVVGKGGGDRLAEQVSADLLELSSTSVGQVASLLPVLRALQLLVDGHLALDRDAGGGTEAEAHMMCAALGGCGPLRAAMQGELSDDAVVARQIGHELLLKWRAERKRLIARWATGAAQTPQQAASSGWWRLQALQKADANASAEGFELSWASSHLPPGPAAEEEPSALDKLLPGTVEYEVMLRLRARDLIQAGTPTSPPRRLPPEPPEPSPGSRPTGKVRLRPLGPQSARARPDRGLVWSVHGPPLSARLHRNAEGPGIKALCRAEMSMRERKRGQLQPISRTTA